MPAGTNPPPAGQARRLGPGASKPAYKEGGLRAAVRQVPARPQAGERATGGADSYAMLFVNGIERVRVGGRLCLSPTTRLPVSHHLRGVDWLRESVAELQRRDGYLNSALATYFMKRIVNTTATDDIGYVKGCPSAAQTPSPMSW